MKQTLISKKRNKIYLPNQRKLKLLKITIECLMLGTLEKATQPSSQILAQRANKWKFNNQKSTITSGKAQVNPSNVKTAKVLVHSQANLTERNGQKNKLMRNRLLKLWKTMIFNKKSKFCKIKRKKMKITKIKKKKMLKLKRKSHNHLLVMMNMKRKSRKMIASQKTKEILLKLIKNMNNY